MARGERSLQEHKQEKILTDELAREVCATKPKGSKANP